jgi:deoxyribodipyrimidine photo-lyase
VVAHLCQLYAIDHIIYNRQYDNTGFVFGHTIKERSVSTTSFNSQLMHEPEHIKTKSGTPFKVFTPFSNQIMDAPKRETISISGLYPPQNIKGNVTALSLKTLNLLPSKNWAMNWKHYWCTKEADIIDQWHTFLKNKANNYITNRDYMAEDATTRLSAALAFGCISPLAMWQDINMMQQTSEIDLSGFKRQLIWREFCYYQLYNFPKLKTQNWKPQFNKFPWKNPTEPNNTALIKAWKQGKTGIPIIDAGMRELWQTGYMHNRVRMIVASFLIKNLLMPWQVGEKWFWDTLVDADPANNAASWQWVAGSGADASPYFRIFNPYIQSEKFDKMGAYIRKWVPELENVDASEIHMPTNPVQYNYPKPIVDTSDTRKRALSSYHKMKES